MQGLTVQPAMEAELVVAVLAMKEAVYCAGMMGELGFEETFKCAPIQIDNTSALHVARNKTYSSRAKHVALRLFYVCEIIQQGEISIRFIPTEFNTADIETKFLSKHRLPVPHRVDQELQDLVDTLVSARRRPLQIKTRSKQVRWHHHRLGVDGLGRFWGRCTITIWIARKDMYISRGRTHSTVTCICFVVRGATRFLCTGGRQKGG